MSTANIHTAAPPADRLVGIDWGTSNRRAYLVNGAGRCLAARADGQGVLSARPHFARSLDALLSGLAVPDGVPVVASGMIGSQQGWREVPYLDLGTPLEELPRRLATVEDPSLGRRCLIVPGYVQRGSGAAGVDVLRGEETQLLGAVSLGRRDGWVVLPGTHSKWVLLVDGAIERFATFMTGELFALLSAHGTLAPLMQEAADDDQEAFAAGLREARRRAPLSHALFGVRARVVSGDMPAAQARGFVSGLLIGTEYVAAFHMLDGAARAVAAIGSPALCALHARAAAAFGVELAPLDPDRVYCAALSRLAAGVLA
jgi:2-dehydro-3-deoxygalactonokinase